MMTKYVELSIKDGPVEIDTLFGAGAEKEVPLWDEIVGRETFPATREAAFYQLDLRKPVHRADEVLKGEEHLKLCLSALSHVWHFAGGTLLIYESSRREKSPRYISNAERIEEDFLAMQGKKKVYFGCGLSWNTIGSYRDMPLTLAANLCRAAASNVPLKKIFEYHYEGLTDNEKWFVHIFNVRDALRKVFGKEDKVRSTLGISSSDWKEFGRILNNYDLRHPEISVRNVTVPKAEIAATKEMARLWILAYLQYLGLSVA